jgi:formylglycine-generating enzyme required for sulfatase activity
VDADGANVRRLTDDPAEDMRPSWSPDGTRIAFSRKQDEDWDIYVIDADGSNLQRLTEGERWDVSPAWSPDGSQIAYMSSVQRGTVEIRLMDADGSNDHPLPGVGRVNEDPAWSPDGTQIVFQSNRDGNWEIYVMDADGSNQRRLTNNPAGDYWPSWGPLAIGAPSDPPATASLHDTWTRPTDDMTMVYVPGGAFQMGSDDDEVDAALEMCQAYYTTPCEREWFEVEQPAHSVVLAGFWIDQSEVTNAQYRRCVEAGACSPPQRSDSDTRDAYYGDSAYDDYPVVHVAWSQADAYCRWAGGRLPTEAEWEYAARGPEGRRYPWGEEYDGTRLNSCDANCGYGWAEEQFDDGHGDTAPVGSYPDGASWCGALDMAGNVWEWMADWFGEYPAERQSNPTGPSSGTGRALRGDAADGTRAVSRAAARHGMEPERAYEYTGFRCARPSSP